MTKEEWFRRTAWLESDASAFFSRLAQSRSAFHKAQYLRIQAHSLAETRQESLVRIALELLQRVFAEFPDPSQLATAHLQAAQCHEQLGNRHEAVAQFRHALDAQSRFPNLDSGTALAFSWFIVEHRLSAHYDEALQVLEAAHLAFPVELFKAATVRAFVAHSRGDLHAASRYAIEALTAAGLPQSPFRYHRSLGLVAGKRYEQVIVRLRKLAAA